MFHESGCCLFYYFGLRQSYVAQAVPELLVFLLQLPECWDYRDEPLVQPRLAASVVALTVSLLITEPYCHSLTRREPMTYSWLVMVETGVLTGSFHVDEALVGNVPNGSHDALDILVLPLGSLWRGGPL